jgi:hypothetical protein
VTRSLPIRLDTSVQFAVVGAFPFDVGERRQRLLICGAAGSIDLLGYVVSGSRDAISDFDSERSVLRSALSPTSRPFNTVAVPVKSESDGLGHRASDLVFVWRGWSPPGLEKVIRRVLPELLRALDHEDFARVAFLMSPVLFDISRETEFSIDRLFRRRFLLSATFSLYFVIILGVFMYFLFR